MSSECSVTGLTDMEIGINQAFFRAEIYGITFALRYSRPYRWDEMGGPR